MNAILLPPFTAENGRKLTPVDIAELITGERFDVSAIPETTTPPPRIGIVLPVEYVDNSVIEMEPAETLPKRANRRRKPRTAKKSTQKAVESKATPEAKIETPKATQPAKVETPKVRQPLPPQNVCSCCTKELNDNAGTNRAGAPLGHFPDCFGGRICAGCESKFERKPIKAKQHREKSLLSKGAAASFMQSLKQWLLNGRGQKPFIFATHNAVFSMPAGASDKVIVARAKMGGTGAMKEIKGWL